MNPSETVLTLAVIERAKESLHKSFNRPLVMVVPRWYADEWATLFGALPAHMVIADDMPKF